MYRKMTSNNKTKGINLRTKRRWIKINGRFTLINFIKLQDRYYKRLK